MAREIVFSMTKELDYHFLYGESNCEVDAFISRTHNDIAARVFSEKRHSLFYVVKNLPTGCLLGAFVDVFEFSKRGLVKSECSVCIRGMKEYPTYAFIGWFIEGKSKEDVEQRYINIPLDFFMMRLESAFETGFNRSKEEQRSEIVEIELPSESVNRRLLPYPESLVKKKQKELPINGEDKLFAFNLMTNYFLSTNDGLLSASVGLNAYYESFDVALYLAEKGGDWLNDITMSYFIRFDNHFSRRVGNIKVESEAVQFLAKTARNNTCLFNNLISEIGEWAAQNGIKIISAPLASRYFQRKEVYYDGIQPFDVQVINAIYRQQEFLDIFNYFSVPFLSKNGFIIEKKNRPLEITQKGYNILYEFGLTKPN